MITKIFEDSVKYAFKDMKTVIKVGILSLFSFLIIPLFMLFGYSYRVTSTSLQGIMINSKDPLPKISPIIDLLEKGLKVFLVVFIYSIPSIIISILIFFNTGLFVIGTQSSFTITLNTGTLFLMLLLITWFISFLLSTIAISHMVENNDLKSAFKIKDLIKIIKFFGIIEYIKFYIITILFIILSVIATFFISYVIINIISYILITIQMPLSSMVVSSLNIFVFVLLEQIFFIPFFVILLSRGTSFMYDPTALE